MPRYTLHRPRRSGAAEATMPAEACASNDSPLRQADNPELPGDFRRDRRVTILDEMPRMLLIDCDEDVAEEWAAQMPGWKLRAEGRAQLPDPSPRLERPPRS